MRLGANKIDLSPPPQLFTIIADRSKASVVVLFVLESFFLCCLDLMYVYIFLFKFGWLGGRLFGNGCLYLLIDKDIYINK